MNSFQFVCVAVIFQTYIRDIFVSNLDSVICCSDRFLATTSASGGILGYCPETGHDSQHSKPSYLLIIHSSPHSNWMGKLS
jgi:hypothetical protein